VTVAAASLVPFRPRPWVRPETRLAVLFLLPAFVVLLAILVVPFAQSLWLSLYDAPIGGEARWVGLGNYAGNLADPVFRQATFNTAAFVGLSVLGKLGLGLGAALLLNGRLPVRGLLRALVLLPWALPEITSALVWDWMLNGNLGAINAMLRAIGLIDANIYWLSSRALALPSVVAVNIWHGFPFFALTLLAALQGIERDIYEAADVDGASAVQKFLFITLPGIMPVLLVSTLLSTIWTTNAFTQIFVLTGGGPSNATATLPIYTYQTAFRGYGNLGQAVSVSAMLIPAIVVLLVLLARSMRRREAGST
jgi:multiple sugar transport system permease protein